MFVSQARSITQQSRLAVTLAWVAGYTNILCLIVCGTATSHVSGTVSQWGRDLVEGRWSLMALSSFLLATFLAGAIGSSLCTETGHRRGWQSIFVLPMALQALLLSAFAILMQWRWEPGGASGGWLYALTGLASGAMGLQNATITRISGGVVRTTHMTGVFTDLGLESVQYLYHLHDRAHPLVHRPAPGTPPTFKRLVLLVSVAGSFALGAGLGAAAHAAFPAKAMFPPVLFLIWIIHQDLKTPICDITPSELVSDELGLPPSMAIFHLRRSSGRRERFHRLPDLIRWHELLPRSKRVVILDFGETSEINENVALELAALLRQAAATGRRMIFAGISPSQYATIQSAGAGPSLDPTTLCPDLELAIARGLAMVEEP